MDLLWGDPARADQESRLDAFGFGPSQRGGSVSNFGTKAIDNFLQQNGANILQHAQHCFGSPFLNLLLCGLCRVILHYSCA